MKWTLYWKSKGYYYSWCIKKKNKNRQENRTLVSWFQWWKNTFIFKYLFTLFIYLAAPGLSCGTRGLQSLWKHTGSLVVVCELLAGACGIQFPDQGSTPGISATEPPRKSRKIFKRTTMHLLQNQEPCWSIPLSRSIPLRQSSENALIKRIDFYDQTQLDVNVGSMPYYLCNF